METEKLDKSKYLFTPCFEIVAWRYKTYKSKVYDKVFGIIYRYSQLKNGECNASVKDTLAPAIGVSEGLFGSTLRVLIEDGLIIEKARGNTNTYIPNIAKVKELYEERKAEKTYTESEHVTSTLEKKKKKFNIREQLRSHKSDVEATSIDQFRPHEQSYEVTGAKERDSYLKESLKDLEKNSKSSPQANAFVDDLELDSLILEVANKFTNSSNAPQKLASTRLGSVENSRANEKTSSSGIDPSSLDEIIKDLQSKVEDDFPPKFIHSLATDYAKQYPEYAKDIYNFLDKVGI